MLSVFSTPWQKPTHCQRATSRAVRATISPKAESHQRWRSSSLSVAGDTEAPPSPPLLGGGLCSDACRAPATAADDSAMASEACSAAVVDDVESVLALPLPPTLHPKELLPDCVRGTPGASLSAPAVLAAGRGTSREAT